ncbi:MAG: hypothetical protein LQ352_001135 [Teloschistes flavicans]|nr:MAG: hypothetical protein LQ352_001135 [Teloschistes flavicans]
MSELLREVGHGNKYSDEHMLLKDTAATSHQVICLESEQKEADQTAETASSDGDSNKGGEDDGSAESDSSGPTRPDHSVEDAGQGTPDTSSDEDPKAGSYELDSGNNVEGVRFKGATSGGTRDGEQGDTRKHIPDAKGGAKHRIESHYGKELGSLKEEDPGDSDKPAGAKSTSSPGSISDKQRGLSNTQTKHSTDIDNDPGKSKKGEGYAETAKAQGAVDPQRPMAENRPGKENATGSQSDS